LIIIIYSDSCKVIHINDLMSIEWQTTSSAHSSEHQCDATAVVVICGHF